eukprot:Nitzschia sp. Nitz4//scaffold59_size112058//10313//11908//NITZ4_004097-RA/size112058-snap-gene-0.25-mRNA-1//1//CDS//3329555087//9098//frame0
MDPSPSEASQPKMPPLSLPPSNVPPHPPTQQTPTEASSFLLSMSSIGFGVDSSSAASWGDATEACLKALQDAMVRSTLRLPMAASAQSGLQINLQLGVPPKQPGSPECMRVDLARLHANLPTGVPVMPIAVTIGGLFIQGEADGSPICTVVACITLQSKPTLPNTESVSPPSTTTTPLVAPPPFPPAPTIPSAVPSEATVVLSQQPTTTQPSQSNHAGVALERTMGSPSLAPKQLIHSQNGNSNHPEVAQRSNSIEVLAMISEVRLAAESKRPGSQSMSEGSQSPVVSSQQPPPLSLEHQDSGYIDPATGETIDENQLRNGTYNYQKLPPGLTMKNNRRLFVRHTYRDYSEERPNPEEEDLLGPPSSVSAVRDSSRTFPLKLHETLTQIEIDGLSDIVGWLPHGRSFKIHKQKEFADEILPKYFVMTKKSSFLRQLNLYGFNRFSAGPDQGSYYHEKFLKGMKFLCRRMSRQKVNGNRIRSAGNPDEEPVLSRYPSCPAYTL